MAIENGLYPRYRINPADATEIQIQTRVGARWEGYEFHSTAKHASLICDRLNTRGTAAPLLDMETGE